jgi:hypothetical protein
MLSYEEYSENLRYCPEVGHHFWRVARTRNGGKTVPGTIAGAYGKNGYKYVGLKGQRYKASRLAFLAMTGQMPDSNLHVDHKNGDPSDDRWANLRLATPLQNWGSMKRPVTNTSGIKGVRWDKARQLWSAEFKVNGKKHFIGRFNDIEAARIAYETAVREVRGEFARFE